MIIKELSKKVVQFLKPKQTEIPEGNVVCPMCNGTGKGWAWEFECETCGDSGHISEDEYKELSKKYDY